MSGRTAVALCLAAFFVTAGPSPVWEWMNTTWNALVATVADTEEPASDPDEEPEVETGGDEGWLIDPNG